ncbi:hypothetical protein PENSPDRAFT_751986 [Peniophora sp. CONT]|nr:hypothetical protein PENSPDRAFT_751986 [Peniophora sp. CONT]
MSAEFSFDYFSALDGLAQVFVSESSRFVLISSVFGEEWTVRLGLVGEGRWWEGVWSEEDVFDFASAAGQDTSEKPMRALCDRLRITIEKGDLGIVNWDPSLARTKDMQFVLNPKAKRPLSIPLRQMSASEASRFTVNHIAKLAESSRFSGSRSAHADTERTPKASGTTHKRRRSPSPMRNLQYEPTDESGSSAPPTPKKPRRPETRPLHANATLRHHISSAESKSLKSKSRVLDKDERHELEEVKRQLKRERTNREEAEKRHRAREAELLAADQLAGGSIDRLRSQTLVPAAARRPGASLANPNQKARKFRKAEFESDSE